ncbi:MAG TPA: DUF885 domain-containing protein [Thermoanaerobaculia bacterium]|nr:DUF885 domain-containing protein [Thermoanaerobaculia bacterium]
MTRFFALVSLGLLLASAAAPAAQHAVEVDYGKKFDELAARKGGANESERLAQLFDLYLGALFQASPEQATFIGAPGYNDRWTDRSLAEIEREQEVGRRLLAALQSFDRARLSPVERDSYDLLKYRVEELVEGFRFPSNWLAINQVGGVQQLIPRTIASMPADTVEHYEDILARLRGLPRVVDETVILLGKGLEAGVTPPRITLRDVPRQLEALAVEDPAKNPLAAAFQKIPESIPAPERERLRREAAEALTRQAVPAFRKLRDYITNTYLPGTRETIAMRDLPNGEAWYAFNVRQSTTTGLTPQQIHDIGLREVARIRAEMEALVPKTGFKGSFEEFVRFLRTDPRFFFDQPEDLVAAYRAIAKRADPELTRLFGRLPRLPYGVIPVPAYAEKSTTTAYYEGGSPATGRPGYYFVNTYDLKSRPKWEMEALTLHEAVPGHHLQIALAQEAEGLPEFRKHDEHTAFTEGWGLYAESLGEEMGFYQDPYSRFGQLTYQMWRAVRLVVDTGMHALGWSRDQAIEYFKANAPKTEHDIVVEVDRYLVWPGQALAYKIGELKIKELRALAQQELGPKFDVRAFHDQVLGRGSVPLAMLEVKVREWIAERKAAGESTAR